jgi:putative tryptophan/tyrosine transport system substrate-binding protein
MKRREFIAGLGGVAAWPVGLRAVRAQQSKTLVIGYMAAGSANTSPSLVPFLQGLRDSGFVGGQNVIIEYRWADGQYDRLPAMAADLVKRRVAVISTSGGAGVAIAAKAATATIPIVFGGGGDPISSGLVASLNKPGGNVTGAINLTGDSTTQAKVVQFLRELVPAATFLGLLVNYNYRRSTFVANYPYPDEPAQAAAHELGWETQVFEARTDDDLTTAFETMAKRNAGAVNVVPDPFFTARRAQIVTLAARYAIPTSYYFREFVIAGGLMSYGADNRETNRVAGSYVGRILKGEKPADLPVQQSTKIELVVNLKTAKALGLTIPPNQGRSGLRHYGRKNLHPRPLQPLAAAWFRPRRRLGSRHL